MEILVGPVVELGKSLCVPLIKDHCGYIYCYAENVEKLEVEVKSLKTQWEDMIKKLDETSRLNRTPLPGVQEWMGSVEEAVAEAEKLSGRMKEEQRCLMGWCPNLRWRHEVGRKATEQIEQVQKLKENRNYFHGLETISHLPPPPPVEERLGNEFVATEMATKVMDQVMDALRDDNVRSIGIYGMGGIGKTTLVNNINNKLKGSGLFDKVIFVTVSQNPNLNFIQDQIVERLGMRLDDKGSSTTGISNSLANRVLEELRKLRSVLIILDDVWKKLKVLELGFPRKDEHECCKIIVTTRIIEVCVEMGMEKKFEVKPLSDKDAWLLFQSKVGDVSKTLLEVGKKIVNKCGGCPLAVVTLGSTLAEEEEEYMWHDALSRLTSPERTQLDGIISEVIPCIEFSYYYLKDKDMKFCFLFCSLFPEDYDISLEYLRIFGIGEGFHDVQKKCLYAKVQLMAYIKRLKNCSLLLEGYTKNHVKMHDVVRLTAQYIASKEGLGFIERTRLGLTHWPDNEEKCQRLSLIGNEYIEALPESSNFPILRTLLLKQCFGITHIPDDFFIGMDALVNLDLSEMSRRIRWPKSISHPTNLRSLLLGIGLSNVDTSFDIDLGKLKKLEVLIIQGEVKIPSCQLAKLSNLKILNLKDVHLELIPANVISRLHNLEELYLSTWNIYDKKEGACKGSDEIKSAASLVEVAALKRLTVLEVRVREEEVLLMPNNGWGRELQEFKIIFGNDYFPDGFSESGNTLVLSKIPELVPEWVICLIQKVELLHLEWRPDLKKVLHLDTVTTLKQMEISNCSTILQIASTEEEEAVLLSINVLQRLEKLRLVELSNLENIICQGPQFLNITESLVMKLRVLEVKFCNNLETLLPPNLLQALPLLEELVVQCCKAMRHIFGTSTTYQGPSCSSANNYDLETRNCLEHLELLKLVDMPNLVTICDGPVPDGFLKNLKDLELAGMPNLVRICDGHVPYGFLKNLKKVRVRNCDELIPKVFAQDHRYSKFPSLETLSIIGIKKMETLVSFRLGGPGSSHLFDQNITELVIGISPTLKSICSFDSTSSTGSSTSTIAYSIFPKLKYLSLSWLEKLDSILWPGSNLLNIGSSSFQNLRRLNVHLCNSLRYLFFPLLAKHLPRLESLKVQSCERLEKLILISEGEEDIKDVLPQLKSLTLRNLPEVTSVFSVETIFLQFPSLKSIEVYDCSKLKHLSLGLYSSPLLKEIRGSQEWHQALAENMTMEMKNRFERLFQRTQVICRRDRRMCSRMITSRCKSWPI